MNRWVAVALLWMGCTTTTTEESFHPVLTEADLSAAPVGNAPAPPDELDLALSPAVQGGNLTWTVTGANANETIYLIMSLGGLGAGPCPPVLNGDCLDITAPAGLLPVQTADASGNATLTLPVPAVTNVDDVAYFQAVALRPGGAVTSEIRRTRISDGSARVRVVHASSDAPAVDVYANGALLVPDLAFGDATPFVSTAGGPIDVELRAAGASPTSPPAYAESLSVNGAADTTVVAAGSFGSTNPFFSFRLVAFEEAWGAVARDTFRTRILHASPSTPGVTLDVGSDGVIDLSGLFRFLPTDAEGVALPSDTSLSVTVGELVSQAVLSSYQLPAIPQEGEVLVIATGFRDNEPRSADALRLLAVFYDGTSAFIDQDPRLYALHASPDAGNVSVSTGGAVVIPGFEFADLAGPLQVPSAAYDLDLTLDLGQPSLPPISAGPFTSPLLLPGDEALLIAAGEVGAGSFQFIPVFETMDFSGSDVPLQVVHACADAPAVDVGIVDANGAFVPLLTDVVYGDVSPADALIVPGGTYSFAVALAGDPNPLFTFPALDVVDGNRFIVVASGSVAAGTFQLQLVDVASNPFSSVSVPPL